MGILCALNTGTLNLVLAERYDFVERCSATGLRLPIICCLSSTLEGRQSDPSQREGLQGIASPSFGRIATTNKDALLDCPNPLR